MAPNGYSLDDDEDEDDDDAQRRGRDDGESSMAAQHASDSFSRAASEPRSLHNQALPPRPRPRARPPPPPPAPSVSSHRASSVAVAGRGASPSLDDILAGRDDDDDEGGEHLDEPGEERNIEKLIRAWNNEIGAPELLVFPRVLVEQVVKDLARRVRSALSILLFAARKDADGCVYGRRGPW